MDHDAILTRQALVIIVILVCGLIPDRLAGPGVSSLRDSLKSNLFNRADLERFERGYYEELLDQGRRLDDLADVPGFVVGSAVERQGIIRAGAKMIAAVSEATVPKISVIVRKAYGAGLYAMCGPAFEPDACIALPTASIAVMGPQAAVNAVYYNKLAAIADPQGAAFTIVKLAASPPAR